MRLVLCGLFGMLKGRTAFIAVNHSGFDGTHSVSLHSRATYLSIVETSARGRAYLSSIFFLCYCSHSINLAKPNQHQQGDIHDTDEQPQGNRNSSSQPIIPHADPAGSTLALPSRHSHVLVATSQVN